jgi:hypothetical protein
MVLAEGQLMLKILAVIALIIIGWWAYNNYEVKTVSICVGQEDKMLPITCEVRDDCVKYLTSSLTGEYPRTDLTLKILDDHASCKMGTCYVKQFNYLDAKGCGTGQMLYRYSVTVKDMVKSG